MAKRLHALGERVAHDDGEVGLRGPLVVAEFYQPAFAPVLRALRFPEDRAAGLAVGAGHRMHHVAAKLPLGHRREDVGRKRLLEHGLDLELLHLPLELLRALFRPPLELLDLLLHGGDRLLLLGHLELEIAFGLALGLLAGGRERFLHPLLDRELELALRIVELALLAQGVGLGLLRRGELLIAFGKHGVEVGDLWALRSISAESASRAFFASASAIVVRSACSLASYWARVASTIGAASDSVRCTSPLQCGR